MLVQSFICMIVLITVHDSSCLVGFLPFVRQFDSAPQTDGVHRIRSSVRRFTCTARTCKDCRKRLILYLYTLPRSDLHACTERIHLQGRTKCLFLFITMQSDTIIHTFHRAGIVLHAIHAAACIIVQEPAQRYASFAIIQRTALSSLLRRLVPRFRGCCHSLRNYAAICTGYSVCLCNMVVALCFLAFVAFPPTCQRTTRQALRELWSTP